MADPICLSPLKFYDSVEKQNHRKSYAYGHIAPLLVPINILPAFQFSIPKTTGISVKCYAVCLSSNKIIELNIDGLSVFVCSDDYTIIQANETELNSLPSNEYYYLKIQIDQNTYYSEIISNIDTTDCLTLEYWNPESNFILKNGVVSFDNNFHFKIYLKTEVGKPEYSFEEEATNRLGYSYIESQVSKKTYKFNIVLPEYLCDAMRIIRLCSNKKIESKNKQFTAITFNMDVEWQDQGDLASVDCEFEVDNNILNPGGFNIDSLGNLWAGGGVTALTDLYDVRLTSFASGDLLYYNGVCWENLPASYLEPDLSDCASLTALATHTNNSIIHITADERANWNKITSLFGLDENGNVYVKDNRGLYSNSFISALGYSDDLAGAVSSLAELTDVNLSALANGDLLMYDESTTHWVNVAQSTIKPDLSAYATITALNTHANNTTIHITAEERTKWNKAITDFNSIIGTDNDNIINKWEEVIAFLDTYTEADTLANLLSNKADKSTLAEYLKLSGGVMTGILSTHSQIRFYSSDITNTDYYWRVALSQDTSGTNYLSFAEYNNDNIQTGVGIAFQHSGTWFSHNVTTGGYLSVSDYIRTIGKKIYFGSDNTSYIELDDNGYFHFSKGLYSDSFVSALGLSNDLTTIVSSLAELTDVTLTTLTNGDLLVYDKNSTHWVNIAQSAIKPDLSAYATLTALNAHANNTDIHITSAERTKWDKVITDLSSYATQVWVTNNYVAKVSGKSLSTNDFTDTLLIKLNSIEENANNYIHPSVTSTYNISGENGQVLCGITTNKLGHVTAVISKELTENDIPSLSWDKIYGITDILPAETDKYTLGNITKRWLNVQTKTISAEILSVGAFYITSQDDKSLLIASHGSDYTIPISSLFPLAVYNTLTAYNILPAETDKYTLGDTDNRWNMGYITTLNVGNIYPVKAASYNIGSTTYPFGQVYAKGFRSINDSFVLSDIGTLQLVADYAHVYLYQGDKSTYFGIETQVGSQLNFFKRDYNSDTETYVTSSDALFAFAGNAVINKNVDESYIQIGKIKLKYDETNNAICVVGSEGDVANFYATGGVSALGYVGLTEATWFGLKMIEGTVTGAPTVTGLYLAESFSLLEDTSSGSFCLNPVDDGINLYISATHQNRDCKVFIGNSDTDVIIGGNLYLNSTDTDDIAKRLTQIEADITELKNK